MGFNYTFIKSIPLDIKKNQENGDNIITKCGCNSLVPAH
jgi:hypothetical protein